MRALSRRLEAGISQAQADNLGFASPLPARAASARGAGHRSFGEVMPAAWSAMPAMRWPPAPWPPWPRRRRGGPAAASARDPPPPPPPRSAARPELAALCQRYHTSSACSLTKTQCPFLLRARAFCSASRCFGSRATRTQSCRSFKCLEMICKASSQLPASRNNAAAR